MCFPFQMVGWFNSPLVCIMWRFAQVKRKECSYTCQTCVCFYCHLDKNNWLLQQWFLIRTRQRQGAQISRVKTHQPKSTNTTTGRESNDRDKQIQPLLGKLGAEMVLLIKSDKPGLGLQLITGCPSLLYSVNPLTRPLSQKPRLFQFGILNSCLSGQTGRSLENRHNGKIRQIMID